ncbi:hypothetical protein, partial [Teichococcus wenyumeiae]|uniref:hypothetical protein n=1 Tax=Teichococcus wenyumeiae TaxID=2478470 RepID=UPI001F173E94
AATARRTYSWPGHFSMKTPGQVSAKINTLSHSGLPPEEGHNPVNGRAFTGHSGKSSTGNIRYSSTVKCGI